MSYDEYSIEDITVEAHCPPDHEGPSIITAELPLCRECNRKPGLRIELLDYPHIVEVADLLEATSVFVREMIRSSIDGVNQLGA
jgi:hypothetical protein